MTQDSEETNALALIPSSPITEKEIAVAQTQLELNFGVKYQPEKFLQLALLIREEGWSIERFKHTLKWFLKNKSYPAWTAADWFSYARPIHNRAWYNRELQEKGKIVNTLVWVYEITLGVYGYSYDADLPLKNTGHMTTEDIKRRSGKEYLPVFEKS